MIVLLDTNVLSETRRIDPSAAVLRFIDSIPSSDKYVSVISIGELFYGAMRMPAGKRRDDLDQWVRDIELRFADRTVGLDNRTAEIWGEIVARCHGSGDNIESADGWIAATAYRHGLHLATRNTRDFAGTGILLVNPWEY